MSMYLTLTLPEGKMLKLLFTRMTEEDNWICQMDHNLMREVQKTIGQGFYGSV
jgi:hypothetical protein